MRNVGDGVAESGDGSRRELVVAATSLTGTAGGKTDRPGATLRTIAGREGDAGSGSTLLAMQHGCLHVNFRAHLWLQGFSVLNLGGIPGFPSIPSRRRRAKAAACTKRGTRAFLWRSAFGRVSLRFLFLCFLLFLLSFLFLLTFFFCAPV